MKTRPSLIRAMRHLFTLALFAALPAFGQVTLLHHDAEGAMGIVLNRVADVLLPAFFEEHGLPQGPGAEGRRLHIGGPCELRRGFLLHQERILAENAIEVLPEVFVSTDTGSMRAVLQESGRPFVFLLGYAGWGAGQLEREVVAGAWLTTPAHAARVFQADPENTWRSALADIGIDPAHLCVSGERH